MISPAAGSVLSLQGVTLGGRRGARGEAALDLDLGRGDVALVQVEDAGDAASLVGLCLGLADPAAGFARFLGVDWTARAPTERLRRRRRVGAVMQAEVWPTHLSVEEAIVLPRTFRSPRPRAEVLAEATGLARLFGLPGLPVGHQETVRRATLVRAACVRGFLGGPDLVVVQDQAVEENADLALPMAQAIAAAAGRGGAVLWIVASLAAQAARLVQADQVLRLEGRGLVRARGRR
jgi:phospholipid/cholesterol/gamma-HCH transport system ATP-binding protein